MLHTVKRKCLSLPLTERPGPSPLNEKNVGDILKCQNRHPINLRMNPNSITKRIAMIFQGIGSIGSIESPESADFLLAFNHGGFGHSTRGEFSRQHPTLVLCHVSPPWSFQTFSV